MPIEFDREADGRWIADVPALRGVMAYGATPAEARTKVCRLALRVIADRLEHAEIDPTFALALGFRVMADQLEDEEPGPADIDRISNPNLPVTIKAGAARAALTLAGWTANERDGYCLLIKRSELRFHEVTGRAAPPGPRPSDYVLPFYDNEELGARMLARIARPTGLKPENLPRPSAPEAAESLRARFALR
jgi:predicted RNase H-like HicB family nuclease